MCNCGCLTYVDCTCPELTGVDAAQILAYITNIYSPAQSITGVGYNEVLYTNSTSSSQTILIETNVQTQCSEISAITTTFKKNGVSLTGSAIMIRENAPVKTDHTHFLTSTVLAPGDNISLTIQSNVGGGAPGVIKWLKAVVYKY